MNTAYIFDAIRTPRGKASEKGSLHELLPLELLSALYKALEQRNDLDPKHINDIILGCVTQTGEQAANVAKTSAMYAGWPQHIPGLTLNRYCSSGIDAINFAAMKVMTGNDELVVAGGVEMMSRAPMLSDKPAAFINPKLAAKLGMLMMGNGADLIASLHNVSREDADQIAVTSHQRAHQAQQEGRFKGIIPIYNPIKDVTLSHDELVRPDNSLEKLAALEPSFAELGAKGLDAVQLAGNPQLDAINHIHTAGNSPGMADAAAILLIGSEAIGKQLNLKPRAIIHGMININDDALQVVSGCVTAAKQLMVKEGLTNEDIDLFEIHEAFAATIAKCKQDLEIDDSKLNVNGGCLSMGHPLGATGAVMAGTLLDELERQDLKRGIVAASGAAGAGTALLIERV
ncbi:acetyl-CoA C-acetyltransferase [Maricurvus nonylphenolicus]|uniref:acetyl-CoA C-acyltransferase n=1 Tax=Maricurvus nonylphenolicus TaxID=1008307 RepID=UPI0036F26355